MEKRIHVARMATTVNAGLSSENVLMGLYVSIGILVIFTFPFLLMSRRKFIESKATSMALGLCGLVNVIASFFTLFIVAPEAMIVPIASGSLCTLLFLPRSMAYYREKRQSGGAPKTTRSIGKKKATTRPSAKVVICKHCGIQFQLDQVPGICPRCGFVYTGEK
jgi:hypothetical protein